MAADEATWGARNRALHPNWEYRLWRDADLDRYDFRLRARIDEARRYDQKADLLRVELMARFGGIYLDTDCECLKALDPLRVADAFAVESVTDGFIANGILGSAPGSSYFTRAVEEIERRPLNGPPHIQTGPHFHTWLAKQPGSELTLYRRGFFFPYGRGERPPARYPRRCFLVHHWAGVRNRPAESAGGARSKRQRGSSRRRRPARRRAGPPQPAAEPTGPFPECRCVLILGTGRSGTSMMGGVLHRLGVHMGDRLHPPSRTNKRGTYEDVEFMRLIRRRTPRQVYRRFFLERARRHPLFGLKYPRAVMVWNAFCTELPPDTRLVVMRRPRAEALLSYRQAYGNHRTGWFDDRTRKIERVLRQSRLERVVIDFDDALRDPRGTVEKVAALVEPPPRTSLARAIRFIDPSLRTARLRRAVAGR